MADAFRTQVLQTKDGATASPVVTLGSCTFMYTREARGAGLAPRRRCEAFWRVLSRALQNNVYVLVVTQGNSNAAAAFRFMRQVRERAWKRVLPPHASCFRRVGR